MEHQMETVKLQFHGSAKEYFKIWVVNLALTILTVGIYSAWAKVRTQRYFHSHTVLAGTGFEYHGKPMQILLGRLILALFFIPMAVLLGLDNPVGGFFLLALGLIAPWLMARSLKFRLGVVSWRNIGFRWRGTSPETYWMTLKCLLTAAFTLFLAYPYLHQEIHRFIVNRVQFGRFQCKAGKSTWDCYKAYFLVVFLTLLLSIAGSLAIAATQQYAPATAEFMQYGLTIFTYGVFLKILDALIQNIVSTNTRLGGIQIQSSMTFKGLAKLYIGNLALLAVTLGLAWPWTKIREIHYRLDHLQLVGPDVLAFINDSGDIGDGVEKVGATGAEFANWFDFDVSL